MPRSRIRFLFPIVCALLTLGGLQAQALPSAAPAEVGLSAERLERLSEALQGYVEDERLAGAVALVLRHGRVAYLEAFGHRDRETGAAQRTDDLFRIASQTKAVVSVAIMMLQEEGALLIGHRVGRYLPEYMETTVAVPDGDGGYSVVPANRPITIRDLLTHTAGVGWGEGPAAAEWEAAGIQGWYFAHRDEPIRETVRRIASLPMDAQPGEQFVYGLSTDVLGAVVEVASGMPLDVFLQARLFEPLGMDDTHFYLPEEKRDRLATVYSALDDGLTEAPDPGEFVEFSYVGQGAYVEGPRVSFSGGAGLLSTAHDYAAFLQMTLNGGELNGARILSPKSVELMTVNHVGDLFPFPGSGFGLGFEVVEDLGERGPYLGSVGEYGWGGAYHSAYWVDPSEELVVVYFTQLIPDGGLDDVDKLRALVYASILHEGSMR